MREIIVKNTPLKDFRVVLEGLNPLDIFTKHRGCPKDLYHTEIVYNNIKGIVPHNNFVSYLKIAYNMDYGIVIKPDFIWYTILCELSSLVNKNPEECRKYFTYKKKGKITLTGENDSLIHMPVDQFVEMVLENIPMDLQRGDIIPDFTTSDDDSRFAFSATFLEMVSNFYTYDWYGCDYNKIKILGNKADYVLMLDALNRFNRIVPLQDYIYRAKNAVQNILDNWGNDAFWRSILWTSAGYGGDRIDGWIKKFFNKGAYWNAHLSQVEAKELITQKTYVTVTGLLSSVVEDGYMIPNFERIIAEKGVDDDKPIEFGYTKNRGPYKMSDEYHTKYEELFSMSNYDRENSMNYNDTSIKPNPNLILNDTIQNLGSQSQSMWYEGINNHKYFRDDIVIKAIKDGLKYNKKRIKNHRKK